MKKPILSFAAILALVVGAHAQNVIESGYTVFVKEGSSAFFAGIDVKSGGLLDVKASTTETNISIDGAIEGDERINFDGELTNLTIDNGTWDVLWNAPDDEVLNTLILGDAGTVIVPPGASLTTLGDYTSTNTGTSITLQADATPAYAQFLPARDGGTRSDAGVMLAEQYLTADGTAGWRQLSSPVNATLAEIEDDLTLVYSGTTGTTGGFLPANPTGANNVFWYDASPIGGLGAGLNASANNGTTFSEANAKHWTAATAGTDDIGPTSLRSWNIYAGGAFPTLDATTPGKIDLDGDFGFGDYAYDCYTTHDVVFEPGFFPNSVDQNLITGWNSIANPYPSSIDVVTLLADAFFTATNADFSNPYAAVHVWNPGSNEPSNLSPSGLPADLQQYIAISNGLTTHINWNTSNPADNTAPNIPPFQSFWVKTASNPTAGSLAVAKTLTLTNDMRSVTKGINYFKTTPPNIRLNVFDQSKDAYRDQTLIAFDAFNTEGLDADDAYKFISPNEWVPSLYTKVEGALVTINRLPNPDPAYSIPLFMDSKKAGEGYKMAMVDENIDPSWTIYLEDVKTGEMHNLRNGEYAFNHDASMKGNRFVVHINKMPGNIDPSSWNNVSIYANTDGINVAFANPDVATAEVIISNLAGQLLYQGTVSTGRVFTYPVNDDVALYAIQVITGQKVTHEKVVK